MPESTMRFSLLLSAALCAGLVTAALAQAQVDAPILYLQRGQLWNSYAYGKTAPPFNNWRRSDVGMDWPGFRPELIPVDVGGPATHLMTGGFWFTSKDSRGEVISVDDFAMYGTSVSTESGSKYRVRRHEQVFKDGANNWLAANPAEAEQLIVSEWEANPNWQPATNGLRQQPIRVRREVRGWGGYKDDQNSFLLEYTITNTSDSTLHDAYAMVAYAFAVNTRSWATLLPNLPVGPRNERFVYLAPQRLMYGYAIDYPGTTPDEGLGFFAQGGPVEQGEFLAPAYPGLKILAVSRNKKGATNAVAAQSWMAPDPIQDQQGPLVGKSGLAQQYDLLADPRTAQNAITSQADPRWGSSRIWSMLSLGPWDIAPGDSVTFAWAEVIGGADYADVVARTQLDSLGRPVLDANGAPVIVKLVAATVQATSYSRLTANANRAAFAYAHRHNITDPPPAPPVTVRLDTRPQALANLVSWSSVDDTHRDPDYVGAEAEDLAGYRLYRSDYLPLGPWTQIADVSKADPRFLSGGTYTVVDSTVAQGTGYYYALTAYDTGHASWPVDPAARFVGTNTNRVPSLESSLFANRTERPFKATVAAVSTLSRVRVVPNPFVARSGSSNPSDYDDIQFVNLPSPATVRIYTMRGILVKTIHNDGGGGIVFWNQVTDYGQFAESGMYVFQIETPSGERTVGKFAIIR